MKTVEFEVTLSDSSQITLPSQLAASLPAGTNLRVMISWDAEPEDALWRQASLASLDSLWAPDDDVYEQLLNDQQTR